MIYAASFERVARHLPAARSTPSSCVIQHAATD
jgi:hypothetical protein